MATIHKAQPGGIPILLDLATNEFIEEYWGTILQERVFPIAFWKIQQLMESSSSEEIALRVKEITNPTLVTAEWMVFEEGMEELLLDPVRQGENYFVLNENNLNALRTRITESSTAINQAMVVSRIGKDPGPTGKIFVFIILSEFVTIPAASTDGASTGMKIPPL